MLAASSTVIAVDPDSVQHFLSSGDTRDFTKFVSVFGKEYDTHEERSLREQIFLKNHDLIDSHNAAGLSWTMAVNHFTDLTDQEFNDQVLMTPQDCSATNAVSASLQSSNLIPSSVDWRERGVVSAVKNQQKCGSCWTFSTVGCLEAHVGILFEQKRAPLLSEQQLVECAGAFDNHGCNGGLPSHAFEYIKHNGGLSTEFTYPYIGKDGSCRVESGVGPLDVPLEIGVKVPGGSVNITEGDEKSVAFYMATRGPVSIAYEVIDDFRHYSSGVYTTKHCNHTAKDVNHAVLAVGYGHDPVSDLDYWTIKNSWSPTWGDEGYFKMERGVNMCGVANCNSFPDLTGEFAAAGAGFQVEEEIALRE